ncbi:tRNA cca-pyrophosphorylase, putative, partial [Ichthyophthirius multifiliis]
MEIIAPDISEQITDKEKQLFNYLLNFINQKYIDVTMRIAGGWVRDKILKKECHDIDIALDNLMGEDFLNQFTEFIKENGQQNLISKIGIIKSNPEQSKHLQTATCSIFGFDVDFVNLRGEEYTENSRIPYIKFGTPLQDAERRDLTINALFYNINQNKIEDFTGKGINDLQNKFIRTPLEPLQTFLDDPLRILRTFRFASKFQYQISPEIIKALKDERIKSNLSSKVSKERIRTELTKIILDQNCILGLKYIYENNLWPVVFEINENCDEIKNQDFYLKKQQESYQMSILAIQHMDIILQKEIFKNNYSQQDIKLIFIMSCIAFPFTQLTFKKEKILFLWYKIQFLINQNFLIKLQKFVLLLLQYVKVLKFFNKLLIKILIMNSIISPCLLKNKEIYGKWLF